jgi:hypothetical protein
MVFCRSIITHSGCLAVWMSTEKIEINWNVLSNRQFLITVTALLFLIKPASFIIKTILLKWPPTIVPNSTASNVGQPTEKSLQNAGQLIGILERLMVFVFILLGKWEGVGFLLAAKSVFRFGDLKEARDMKLTEYILIGTLLSFGMAILIALTTSAIISD